MKYRCVAFDRMRIEREGKVFYSKWKGRGGAEVWSPGIGQNKTGWREMNI